MRDRARHLTTARRRPRWRPATGGRKDAIPRVARLPRAPGHRTWAWDGRPSPALSPPFPGRAVAPAPAARCAGPAAARSRSGGRVARPGWGPSGSLSCLTVPLPWQACPALGSLGYPGARDLTGRPAPPGAAGAAWREWRAGRPVPRCRQPLVPTGSQSRARIFSNNTVLAGAPLRNRTVDLLLTI